MSWIAVAVGGAAVVGGVVSASQQSKAAKSAANAQVQAGETASDTQLAMYNQTYNQTRADQAPWLIGGENALATLNGSPIYNEAGNTIGMTGGLLTRGPGEFKESPSYQFMLGEGQKGIQRAASATGRLGSGAYLRDATKYAEGLASTEYDNFLRRYYESLSPYFTMAGLGSNVAMSGGNQSQGTANALSGIYQNQGQAQAAGNLGAAYPWSSLANYGAGQMGQYAVNQSYNQGGNQNSLPNYWQQAQYNPQQMNSMTWL